MQRINESFLQYVWQHQLLEGDLLTADGLPVQIQHPGILNPHAGPDFTDARLLIGSTRWAGNVEIHVHASDWHRHHHNLDRAYDNVILHVVYTNDTTPILQNHHPIPTLPLASHIPQSLWDNYEALLSPPQPLPIPCASRLPQLSPNYIAASLERLLLERLESKCLQVRTLLDQTHGNWDHTALILLAHYFGGPANALPFELLALSLPPTLLARWRDNPLRTEALLMGQSGLLDGYFDDPFPRALQADYQALRAAASLTPLSPHLWRFARLRPASFPTLRISQFAQLLSRTQGLLGLLLETTSAEPLQRLFHLTASPYWTHHYRFDAPSPGSPKHTGPQFADRLIINACVPLLFEYGNSHSLQSLKDRAVELLAQLPPESNSPLRLWRAAGLQPRSAAQSQALLHLHHNYCLHHKCLNCQIGYKIITQ